jgi:UDP-GlcNAc3NAcA epimerase
MKVVKILTIIGARPQIIKAAALSRAIRNTFSESITEVLVHTGQHYDANMSEVFFEELQIPKPDHNLAIGSGSHSKQTSMMLHEIGELLLKENPDVMVLYGDTNSTLAASIAASKLHIPIVHIEGGLRSYNKKFPEEINRLITDHVSTLIFTPTTEGFKCLLKEGFSADNQAPFTLNNPGIFHCGDIMYDNSLYFSEVSDKNTTIVKDKGLTKNKYILVTIHRDINTDNVSRLNAIMSAIATISEEDNMKVIIPLHPRTSKILEQALEKELYDRISSSENIILTAPVSFLEMIALEKNAFLVMTDSGGVQKEAYFFNRPSIIFLEETPWVELVESGTAKLVDASKERIEEAYAFFRNTPVLSFPEYYGDGHAAEFICNEILKNFQN